MPKNENENQNSTNENQSSETNTNQQTEGKESKQSQQTTDSKGGSNGENNDASNDSSNESKGILGEELSGKGDEEPASDSDGSKAGESTSEGGEGSGDGDEETEEVEEYEIAFSDDSPLSEEDQDELVELVNDYGLNEEQAKGLVEKFEGLYKNGASVVENQLREKVKKERDALLKSEYYATDEKKAETLQAIREVSAVFAGIDFKDRDSLAQSDWLKFLNSSAGNSVALTKFMLNIHERLKGDDAFVRQRGNFQGDKETKSVEEQWYPQYFEK